MARLRTTPAARDDIRDIRTFSKARFGARVARDYLDGLIALLDRVAARPQTGAPEPALGENMRSFGYKAHRIYYRLDGEDVLVVRILHQARDIAASFGSPQ